MKKIVIWLLATLLCMFVLTSCLGGRSAAARPQIESPAAPISTDSSAGKETPEEEALSGSEASDDAAQTASETTEDAEPLVSEAPITAEPAVMGKTVFPLPSTLDLQALTDCSFVAGFEAKDVSLEDGNRPVIRLTVYDAQFYDAAEIESLKPADVLLFCGEPVPVQSVVIEKQGTVVINGGTEQGGLLLDYAQSGSYYPVCQDYAQNFYPLGQVTLPVAPDFVFRESEDITQPEKVLNFDELLAELADSQRAFTPDSTTVTVQNGQITGLTVVVLPW